MNFTIPKLPLAHGIDVALDWLTLHIAFITKAFSHVISILIDGLVHGLLWLLSGRRSAGRRRPSRSAGTGGGSGRWSGSRCRR